MKKIVLSLLLLLLWPIVAIIVGSIQESTNLHYVQTLEQERDALYKNFNDPSNGAHDYLGAFKQFVKVPTKTVEKEVAQITEHGWKEPSVEATQWIDANASSLELVQVGNAKPMLLMPRFEHFSDPLQAPPLTVRDLANILVASGKRAETHGDLTNAMRYYMEAIKFGYGLETDRSLIAIMMGIAVRNLALPAFREAAQKVTDTSLVTHHLEELRRMEKQAVHLSEAFKTELLGSSQAIHEMYSESKQGRHSAGTQIEDMKWLDQALLSSTSSRNPFWSWYLSERRTFGYLSGVYLRMIEYSNLSYPKSVNKSKSFFHSYMRPKNNLIVLLDLLTNPIGKLFAWIAVPNTVRAQETYTLAQANVRATELALALQFFKLQHGQFPQTLTDLDSALGFQVPLTPSQNSRFGTSVKEAATSFTA